MIVAVGSWRGHGSTTTAVLLARHLHRLETTRDVYLVEADPAGGVLRARLGVRRDTAHGLEVLAFPPVDRSGRAAGETVAAAVSVQLGGVGVVTAPGDPFHAWACHQPRSPWVAALAALDAIVVVDVGRLRGATPLAAVSGAAQLLVLVSDDDIVSVSAALDWIASGGRMSPWETAPAWSDIALVVVSCGPVGEPIRAGELAGAAGGALAGVVPYSPTAARAFDRGADPDDRRWRRDPLTIATMRIAVDLRERLTSPRTVADDQPTRAVVR